MIQPTSRIAFKEIKDSLGDRQLQVYLALKQLGEATNTMISQHLFRPINTITPRCKELRDKKLVGVGKIGICPITERRAIFWRVTK